MFGCKSAILFKLNNIEFINVIVKATDAHITAAYYLL